MATVTLGSVARVPSGPDVWAHVGQRQSGSWVAWLSSGVAGVSGTVVTVDDDRLLDCPGDIPPSGLIDALSEWPFERLASWARVEIGSVIVIVGDGVAARRVADACHRRGALACGIWGSPDAVDAADVVVPRDADVRRALACPLDAVIVLAADEATVVKSLSLPRDRGVVVISAPTGLKIDVDLYPDLHRRGLTVTIASPHVHGRDDRAEWDTMARRIVRLRQLPALPRR